MKLSMQAGLILYTVNKWKDNICFCAYIWHANRLLITTYNINKTDNFYILSERVTYSLSTYNYKPQTIKKIYYLNFKWYTKS